LTVSKPAARRARDDRDIHRDEAYQLLCAFGGLPVATQPPTGQLEQDSALAYVHFFGQERTWTAAHQASAEPQGSHRAQFKPRRDFDHTTLAGGFCASFASTGVRMQVGVVR